MDRHSRELVGYGVAVAAVALALVIKVLFSGLGADHPFVLLPAAVIVSAWYGGGGPGLLAAVLAAIGTDILFLPPAGIGILSDDLFALVAILAKANLIVDLTVRTRNEREHERHETESRELASPDGA